MGRQLGYSQGIGTPSTGSRERAEEESEALTDDRFRRLVPHAAWVTGLSSSGPILAINWRYW